MVDGGRPLQVLEGVRAHHPIAFHGVSMNLGGTDALDEVYLTRLRRMVDRFEPFAVSDHLCWTRHDGQHLHDLLPLPFAESVVRHVAERIQAVQDVLGRRLLIENVSSYAEFPWEDFREWEFLMAVAEQADCLILLDLNNIVVSAHNHGFDAHEYLTAISQERVAQHHLAGHTDCGELKIDTHDRPICATVLELYGTARDRFGPVPVCIERDEAIPELEELLAELDVVTALGEAA